MRKCTTLVLFAVLSLTVACEPDPQADDEQTAHLGTCDAGVDAGPDDGIGTSPSVNGIGTSPSVK